MNITVLAHEVERVVAATQPLTATVRYNQIHFTYAATAVLLTLTFLAVWFSKYSQSENARWKTLLFLGMVLLIIANSAYLVGSTLYVNAKSVTNGPVHWHADFEVWDCGEEIELIDPVAPSNKVGSPLLHEHNDKQIHVEETVFDFKTISLAAFFRITGGDLHTDYLKMPTNSGVVERRNGDLCPDGREGTLQIFLYKAGSFNQQKMTDPEDYLMTPEQKVPPGDCIIVEFGPPKEQTDKLCQSYKVAREKQNGR